MPFYTYRAIDRNAKVHSGSLQAASEHELEQGLGQLGLTLISARGSLWGTLQELLQPKFGEQALQDFTYLLKLVSTSGISLVSGLREVSEGHADKRLRNMVHDLCTGIESGRSLSETMQSRPEIFPDFYVQMIRAGEMSGTLDKSVEALLGYLEWQTEFKKTIRSYYVYPVIIFSILILLSGVLIIFVFPALLKVFVKLKTELPLPTKILVGVAGFIKDYFVFLVAGIGGGSILLKLWSWSRKGRRMLDSFYLVLPVVGNLVTKINLSRYFKTLATLHSSGLDIQETFAIATTVISNTVLQERLSIIREAISSGESISKAMARTGAVQHLVVEMVAMGERTGSLDSALFRICEIYDREVPETIKKVFTVIEPLIVLVMGFMVLMVLLAIFLPIYGIVGHIKVR